MVYGDVCRREGMKEGRARHEVVGLKCREGRVWEV